jgi:hypothetical protein
MEIFIATSGCSSGLSAWRSVEIEVNLIKLVKIERLASLEKMRLYHVDKNLTECSLEGASATRGDSLKGLFIKVQQEVGEQLATILAFLAFDLGWFAYSYDDFGEGLGNNHSIPSLQLPEFCGRKGKRHHRGTGDFRGKGDTGLYLISGTVISVCSKNNNFVAVERFNHFSKCDVGVVGGDSNDFCLLVRFCHSFDEIAVSSCIDDRCVGIGGTKTS